MNGMLAGLVEMYEFLHEFWGLDRKAWFEKHGLGYMDSENYLQTFDKQSEHQ